MTVDPTRRSGLVLDVAGLIGVPTLLVVVFTLPEPTRLELALAYSEPTLLSAYTMYFVHLSADHLLSNLAAYLLVVPVTYVLALRAGRRDVFRIAFVAFLTALPLVLSGLNLLIARPRIGFGFSGINMAFLGLLPVMLLLYLGLHAPTTFDLDSAPALFFAGAAFIAASTVPTPRIRVGVTAVAAAAAALYLRELLPVRRLRADVRRLLAAEGVEHAVVGLLVFCLLPVTAFPTDPVGAGTVVNLYSHLLGYCLGFIATYATVSLLRADERRGRSGSTVASADRPTVDLD